MDADELLNQIQLRTHPQGEVLIHVVTHDREYWLEVTGTDRASHGAIPWIDGVVIEARPIPEGSRASREITTPRPFFAAPAAPSDHHVTYTGGKIPDLVYPESKVIEDLACKSPEQIMEMRRTGELQAIYGVDPGDIITSSSEFEFTMSRPEATKDLFAVERDDHAARIPLLPEPQEITGKFTIPLYDESEPHYEAARELNTSIINDLLVKGAQEEFEKNTDKENDQ